MDPIPSRAEPVPLAAAAPAARTRPAGRRSPAAYAFLAPAFVILLAFLLIPAIWVFGLSLFRWDLIGNNPAFVGLANFQRLLARDDLWWQSVRQTVYFTAGPNDETHGLFGALTAVPEPSALVSGAIALLIGSLLYGRYRLRRAT